MARMTKSKFIQEMQRQTGMSRKAVKELLQLQKEILLEAVISGQKVVFSGFGSFEVKMVKGRRQLRDLDTDEKLPRKKYLRLKYKMSRTLEKELDKGRLDMGMDL